jgi:hypothetical protein
MSTSDSRRHAVVWNARSRKVDVLSTATRDKTRQRIHVAVREHGEVQERLILVGGMIVMRKILIDLSVISFCNCTLMLLNAPTG